MSENENVSKRPPAPRRYPLGLGPVEIAAGATCAMNTPRPPGGPFLPERLVIASDIAKKFKVVGVRVNGVSISHDLPAIQFSEFGDEDFSERLFGGASVTTSDSIQITVRNDSREPAIFAAAILGVMIEENPCVALAPHEVRGPSAPERDLPLSFEVVLDSGEEKTVETAKPPCPFRARSLFVPADFASAIQVVEIRVNGEPTFGKGNDKTPARLFVEFAEGRGFDLGLPVTTEPLEIVLRNTSGAKLTVSGAVLGRVQEPHPGRRGSR